MTACAACLWAGQKQNRASAIRGLNGLVRQSSLRIEACEQGAQFVIRLLLAERKSVFLKRRGHAIAGKHRRALYHRRGADAVHAHSRCKRYRQLAYQMTHRCFADVVSFASAFGNHGVGGTGKNQRRGKILFGEDRNGFVGQKIVGGDV